MYEEKVRKFKCYYCPDCKLYAGSETKIVHGRRMKPNTKYCTGGKKVIIFRSDDPKVNVPKWCPKRRVPPTLRIYHFRSPEIEAGESMLAANGISFFPFVGNTAAGDAAVFLFTVVHRHAPFFVRRLRLPLLP